MQRSRQYTLPSRTSGRSDKAEPQGVQTGDTPSRAILSPDTSVRRMAVTLTFRSDYAPPPVNNMTRKLQAGQATLAETAPSPVARANVGIAMGTGTDVAMSGAHLPLVKGDLRGIAAARRISEATVANMRRTA